MATHYDLEEQEQIAQLKHFWAKYGNLITWMLIVVLGAFAVWNGWQYWQRKSALEGAALYEELDRAVAAADTEKVKRVWSDLQQKAGRTTQAHQGALLAAKALESAGQIDEARQALVFVVDKGSDASLASVARIRLAGLELQAQQHEAAIKWLSTGIAPEFAALAADRKGDVLQAQGQSEAARSAYQEAWSAMEAGLDYRRMVEAKLNALGVDPNVKPKQETER